MPRELKKSERIEKRIFDGLTGETFSLYHKSVMTNDRIAYQSAMMNLLTKKGGIEEVSKLQLEWVKKYLTGVEPGYFTYDGIPLSSEETDTREKYETALTEFEAEMLVYNEYEEKRNSPNTVIDNSISRLVKPEQKVKGIYNPGWKEIVESSAGDILLAFGKYLFGETSFVLKEDKPPFLAN